MTIIALFLCSKAHSQKWLPKGQKVHGEAQIDLAGSQVALSADGLTMAMSAPENDGNGLQSGHVKVYSFNGIDWAQKGQDIQGANPRDFSGSSLALNGDGSALIIGSHLNDDNGPNAGHVRIYSWDGVKWVQKGVTFLGDSAQSYMGASADISSDGNTIVLGAFGTDHVFDNAGAVRVFNWTGAKWEQVGATLYGQHRDNYFGLDVSISADGSTIAIGSSVEDSTGKKRGEVEAFAFILGQWNRKGQVIHEALTGNGSEYDLSLNHNGKILAVGSSSAIVNDSIRGACNVYKFTGNKWVSYGNSVQGRIAGERYGQSIDLNYNGNIIAIGSDNSSLNGPASGHVDVLEIKNDTWVSIGQRVVGDTAGALFGTSVALDSLGHSLVVGSIGNSSKGVAVGNVSPFELCRPSLDSITVESNCVYNSPSGKVWSKSGLYHDTLVNARGCDSFIRIDLKIIMAPLIESQPNDTSMESGDSTTIVIKAKATSYRWQRDTGTGYYNIKNDANFIGVDQDSLKIRKLTTNTVGFYLRCITAQGYCRDTSSPVKVIISSNSSVKPNPNAHQISIFPNPCDEILHVTVHQIWKSTMTLELRNIAGSLVRSYGLQGSTDFDLDVRLLKSGVYYLLLKHDDFTYGFRKVIII